MCNHKCNFVCRRCLTSYSGQNVLTKHRTRCNQQKITSFKTSNESHLYWRKHFHKNPLGCRIFADFEAENETDTSTIGNKTTNIFKQKPALNSYYIVSQLDDILKSGYYESPLGYDHVDWFVVVVIKSNYKKVLHFEKPIKYYHNWKR